METRTRGRTDGRRGFTLVELIAVIGIIALMSTLVLGGFSGILGAISSDSCENTFRRAISRARQEACVTGKETFVWVTGVRSFVVVRAASTITDSKDGGSVSFAPSWYRKKGEESSVSVKDKDVIWIVDEDADLADAQEQHRFDSNASDADLQRYVDSYEGVYVFDMDGAAWARVKYPPWYEFSIDAWVFGIRKDFPNGKFKARSAYGWSVMPEQHLPAGFVFDVSTDEEGNITQSSLSRLPRVQFHADGTVDNSNNDDIPIIDESTQKKYVIKVDPKGMVSMKAR